MQLIDAYSWPVGKGIDVHLCSIDVPLMRAFDESL